MFTLYGTSACHLCELAEDLLLQLQAQGMPLQFEKCDIASSDELFERYGTVIPVVACEGGRELGWPFDLEELLEFVSH